MKQNKTTIARRFFLLIAVSMLLLFFLSITRRFTPDVDHSEGAAHSQKEIESDSSPPPQNSRSQYERFQENLQAGQTNPQDSRRLYWKANFPWTPSRDKNVIITQEILNSRLHEPEVANHSFLRGFFENEARFTPQFEALYRLLDKHDRSDNPVLVGEVFESLWMYHHALKERDAGAHDNPPSTIDQTIIEELATTFRPETYSESIVSLLMSARKSPDKPQFSVEVAEAIRDRIIDEIADMNSIPRPVFGYHTKYEDELKPGDIPLTPYSGWQGAYDRWEEDHEAKITEAIVRGHLTPQEVGRAPKVTSDPVAIGPGRVLLNQNGLPITADHDIARTGSLITPDGRHVPLKIDNENRVVIPHPNEFE
jgi:hypothetical protein